jgi:hypothetical protein
MSIPILTITGQYDGAVRGAMTYFQRHMEHGSDAGRPKHYLLFGPWDHGGTRRPSESVGGLKFGKASLLDINRLHLEWYNWTLKEGPQPDFFQKRLAYYVTGTEEWRFADALEEIPAKPCRLYLQGNAGASYDLARPGLLAAHLPEKSPPASYRYDPLKLGSDEFVKETGGDWVTSQLRARDLSGDGLVYESEPLADATEITGFVRLVAWITLNVPDTDFQATVSEIKPDGNSVLLAEALMRARYRTSLRKEVLVKPGEINAYQFTGFPFFSRRLEKGSRLRLVFTSPNSMRLEKNYNSGGEVALETKKDARVAQVTVHQEADHTSYLEIPVVRPKIE